jgi:hypothetical protein
MASLILDENLEAALERVCRGNGSLTETLNKVSGTLKAYAAHRRITHNKLRVLDISNDGGDLNTELLHFLQSASRLPRQTETRRKRYLSENLSRIGQLISAITGIERKRKKNVVAEPETILLEEIPDYLKAVLDKVPHLRSAKRRNIENLSDRLKLINRNALLILLALCRVAKASKNVDENSPLKSLLVGHYKLVVAELRSMAASTADYRSVYNAYLRLIKNNLHLDIEFPPSARLDHAKWPEPFRSQYDQSKLLATGKAEPDQSLLDSADRHGFTLRILKESSFKRREQAIAQTLPLIPYGEKLNVADLLRLKPTKVKTEEGTLLLPRNRQIDNFRNNERSRLKTGGYDTSNFILFLQAIRGIGIWSGYGHLVKKFNEAYKLKVNRKKRRDKRAAKKKAIERKWLDKELDRLCKDFGRIVRARLFERKSGRKTRDADRAMRLCLFLPQALTMRILSYRQQAIRVAVSGVNIKFLPGGIVALKFSQQEVKNKHALYVELKPCEGGTHERLRRVLIAYHRYVWPYIQKHPGTGLGRQFFVCFDGKSERFRAFKNATDYYVCFSRYVKMFINVHELEPEFQDGIHPHFLRGLCADWMVIDLKIPEEDAAKVLGNTKQVLVDDYLDPDRMFDVTHIIDNANAGRRKKVGADNGLDGRQAEKNYEEKLDAQEKLIKVLTDTLALQNNNLRKK